ncbi:MAG: glucosamine-6-phosphate deaminase [Treponemataceae bacterium]
MNVVVTKDHNESCMLTAKKIADIINANTKAVLGLATGGTAEQVYAELVTLYKAGSVSFKNVHTLNLDEYVGLAGDHDQSYRYFMNKHLFNNVDIDKNNTFVPCGTGNQEQSLAEFQSRLAQKPRDFQLLGVGPNGHIAFNEPASALHSDAHIVEIASATIKANARYFATEADVPRKAFTQGMGDIMKAKSLALLATGKVKADAMKALLLNDEITTDCPCTFLKAHPDATIYIDKELADTIGYKG